MNADSLSHFADALKQCSSCASQCTAALPISDLARVVKEAVFELAPPQWGGADTSWQYPPETLLLLLTYRYACGVFGSEEIAVELEERADHCAFVDQLAIDASTLAAFRREHRGLLRRCLAAVLRRLNAAHLPGLSSRASAALETPELAAWLSLPLDPEVEAERRIVLAAQTDSEERDL